MVHGDNDWQVTLSYDVKEPVTSAQAERILELLEPAEAAGSFGEGVSVTLTANAELSTVALNWAVTQLALALIDAGVERKGLEYIEVCRYEED